MQILIKHTKNQITYCDKLILLFITVGVYNPIILHFLELVHSILLYIVKGRNVWIIATHISI